MHRPIVATIIAAATLACFSKPTIEKEFPGGDLYDEKRGLAEEEQRFEEITPVQNREPMVEERLAIDGLRIAAKVPNAIVSAGTPITVDVTVTNENRATMPLTYNTEQRFEALVFADLDQQELIYVWSDDRYFAERFQETFLGAGVPLGRRMSIQTASNAALEKMDAEGRSRPLPPGIYFLWVVHEGDPYLATGPIEIQVTENEEGTE